MAPSDKNEIYLSSSPHSLTPVTTRMIMLTVIGTLLPVAAWGVYLFGIPALVNLVAAVVSCVVFEALFRKLTRQDVRIGDFSAVITGLLLAMVITPVTPVWMTVLGSFFAIVVGKEFFGGLGANVFNPALVGRAFMFVSFAQPMTTWISPRTAGGQDALASASYADAITSATPLTYIKPVDGVVQSAAEIADKSGFFSSSEVYLSYFFGHRGGCIGESAIFLLVAAFLLLLITRVIDWRAPVAMVVTAVAVTFLAGIDPLLTLLSGGLVFGAVFMVTDYATSPVTPLGRIIFGAGCGLITGLIRVFGGFPEGVMFAILIMNALVPFLDRLIPRKYGKLPREKGGQA
ncbi:MAG TPA: RnfABCDGE type electron transport complex subunit D [Treponemataceae bacterium]|jgi:electron transport complex protein RnfD|nr:RnfABCDGE type electron transport complex subunit D [Treponemataceae bacterium]HQB88383.1 RnfABCDGE type electron transport complex subunit D [Treponemataceae bacterium]